MYKCGDVRSRFPYPVFTHKISWPFKSNLSSIMKSSSLILAALATTTTAIPRGGLPSSEYTCDNGYTATCCRSSLNQLGGGPNVADCSSRTLDLNIFLTS